MEKVEFVLKLHFSRLLFASHVRERVLLILLLSSVSILEIEIHN
jgi:hypothetical protein